MVNLCQHQKRIEAAENHLAYLRNCLPQLSLDVAHSLPMAQPSEHLLLETWQQNTVGCWSRTRVVCFQPNRLPRVLGGWLRRLYAMTMARLWSFAGRGDDA